MIGALQFSGKRQRTLDTWLYWMQLLPIFRVLILVWNDLWSYWTIVSCYEMGVEKWKWYDMSILLILNVRVTKWVHFAIWLILDQSEQNSLTLLIFVMKWVTHIGQYEWFYLYAPSCRDGCGYERLIDIWILSFKSITKSTISFRVHQVDICPSVP